MLLNRIRSLNYIQCCKQRDQVPLRRGRSTTTLKVDGEEGSTTQSRGARHQYLKGEAEGDGRNATTQKRVVMVVVVVVVLRRSRWCCYPSFPRGWCCISIASCGGGALLLLFSVAVISLPPRGSLIQKETFFCFMKYLCQIGDVIL